MTPVIFAFFFSCFQVVAPTTLLRFCVHSILCRLAFRLVFAWLRNRFDDFRLVEMCFFGSHMFKKLNVCCFSLASLCQGVNWQIVSTEHPSAHCISRQQVSITWMFGRQLLGDIFIQSRPVAVEALKTMWPDPGKFWFFERCYMNSIFLKQARTCLDVTWNCAKRVRCYMKVLRA